MTGVGVVGISTTGGIGELTFPDEETIHLKPLLLSKREKLRQTRPIWSLLIPLSSLHLWFIGLNLLLYPVGVILLRKYREDFQNNWRHQVATALPSSIQQHQHQQQQEGEGGDFCLSEVVLPLLARGSIALLDGLAVWVIDLTPQIASALLVFHIGLCLAYVSYTILFHQETNNNNDNEIRPVDTPKENIKQE